MGKLVHSRRMLLVYLFVTICFNSNYGYCSIEAVIEAIRGHSPERARIELRRFKDNLSLDEIIKFDVVLQSIQPDEQWMTFLSDLCERFPESGLLKSHLARLLILTNHTSEGMDIFKQAVTAEPDNPVLLYRAAMLAYISNQYDSASRWIDDLLRIEPVHADGLFVKGALLSRRGEYEQARRVLLEAARLKPEHPLVYQELGVIENADGRPDRAEGYLRKAVQDNPFHLEAYNQLIVSLARQKKNKELEPIRDAAAYLNSWGKGKLNRIHSLESRKELLTADEAFELAVEYCSVERSDLAQRLVESVLKTGRENDRLRFLAGQIEYFHQNYQNCLEHLEQVSDSRLEGLERYWELKTGSLLRIGRMEEFRSAIEAALKQYPDSISLRELLRESETAGSTQRQFEEPEIAEKTSDAAPPASTAAESNDPASCMSSPLVPESVAFQFADASEASGITTFEHRLGHADKRWIIDAMGSGVAVGDYDNDGDDDLYFVNGRPDAITPDLRWRNALFRNDGGRFTDVTEQAGVGDPGFGMAAVWGDVNNDGWIDLYVGNYGRNVLYLNRGDGTFEDISTRSGADDDGYCAGLAFGDVDHDGDLDLYVGNYVDFDPARDGDLRGEFHGMAVFPHPLAFNSQPDRLLINDGFGGFHDEAVKRGLRMDDGRAMGVVFMDLDLDGDLDLYVANDSSSNCVFLNIGDGYFEDMSYSSGGAFTKNGQAHASMGLAPGDFDNDGFIDLAVTSYAYQTDLIYRNLGGGLMDDVTGALGLSQNSYAKVTWGVHWCDFNSDGFLDLFTANGHLYPQADSLRGESPYKQGVSFYQNLGTKFMENTEKSMNQLRIESCRGSALLDYDGDGDMDIAVNCIDSHPLLLENRTPSGSWIKVKLAGTSAQTYGVRITATAGKRIWMRMVDGGSSYLSQSSAVQHFGFGSLERIDAVTVYWLDAPPTRIGSPLINQTIVIKHP
ncbi:MAG: tetratricopeptide repeat protein [bacterium]|nr:tetratricopeptide repeat protein [bacterium]